ncbi:TatD family hydrolase [Symbiobacterium thermophilum]|uniref:TatD-related DNase n=2 Tax=Symbiobacterium thermophilum TaxID=2734 RepID=Q67JB7_SYMTH|nr:TatD family hydrolase [Symbiobacterium thermophilum]MBY6276676.1 TatD family deoxyribonuclease [Symbiobacterium thermophilum]BAD42233.1 TatD-related DNase [Symbiobacterium thermophilum IAM 14863]
MLFNTHSHVDTGRQFAVDRDEVVARAREMGVSQLMVIGFERALIPVTLAFAERHDWVWAAVGIHPTSALEWGPDAERELREAARSPKVRAIGEVGLDYYWKDKAPFEVQRDVFRQQIRLARDLGLPLVIHNRDAHEDVVRILEEEGADEVGGIMHCFSGDWEMAERCLALNFYIGIGGTVTYKNNPVGREVAQRLPLDRIVLETDDPYLAPVPYRGKRNEPGYVRIVAEFVAELRGLTLEAIAEATMANARRALRLDA